MSASLSATGSVRSATREAAVMRLPSRRGTPYASLKGIGMPGASADRRHDGHTAAMEPSIAKAVRYARGKATDWHRRDRHDGIRIKIARALAAGHG